MNRKLDLRTGRPVWMAYRAPRVETSKLVRDIKTDVLVVGMGISGGMIAEALTADGRDVIVVDRRGAIIGSTPATTALVQYEIDQPLTVLAGKIGKAKAEAAWRRSRLAVANLSAKVDEVGIACAKLPRPSLLLAGNVLGPGALREEAEARRAAGLAAEYLTSGRLRDRFGIDREAALVSPDNLAVDPRKLAAGLHGAAIARGARYYAPVEATTFSSTASGIEVGTRNGPAISAKHVVLATGYELASIVPPKGHSIVSTWAIATRPQKSALWPQEAFVWEASDPYLYLRATADGRVICGGEDEEFHDEGARDALIGQKSARISEKLKKLMPAIDPTPEFAWAGSFGTTSTGLPIIAKAPRHPRIHAVMGYGGNGITFSRIASEIVRTELSGGTDADAGLFRFPE
ncbi:MAG: FAD-binding oxidoreductase [Mesorhizobium sp.]|nr:FAD-dependent oxidoreductase [Mesorhizobium sp.]MCO5162526.1 FAD-binding oxidoreductase [Mesorhizobium sp.]